MFPHTDIVDFVVGRLDFNGEQVDVLDLEKGNCDERRETRRKNPSHGGIVVTPGEAALRVLLIDSNVYFVKRMTEALKKEGLRCYIIRWLVCAHDD